MQRSPAGSGLCLAHAVNGAGPSEAGLRPGTLQSRNLGVSAWPSTGLGSRHIGNQCLQSVWKSGSSERRTCNVRNGRSSRCRPLRDRNAGRGFRTAGSGLKGGATGCSTCPDASYLQEAERGAPRTLQGTRICSSTTSRACSADRQPRQLGPGPAVPRV
jgi:hypothetical protein